MIYQTRRTTMFGLAASSATLAATTTPSARAMGPAEPAPFEIVWNDSKRGRVIRSMVYLPAADGPAPTAFFSPGLGGHHSDYSYLGRDWARQGFVTITFDHPGSNRAIFEAGGQAALRKAMFDRANVVNRVEDIRFAMDQIFADAVADRLKGRIDRTRMAMTGHSYGAFATMAVAGLKFNFGGNQNYSNPDSRFVAAISMGGQGREDLFFGIHDGSWDAITIPVMTMTGTLDAGSRSQDYTWRNEPFEAMQRPNVYNVVIRNAGHNSYYDHNPLIPAGKPNRDARHWDWITRASGQFLSAYLRDDQTALAWLRSERPMQETNGEMQLSHH